MKLCIALLLAIVTSGANAQDPCTICPDGLTVALNFEIPTGDASSSITCQEIIDSAALIVDASSEVCQGLKMGEQFCCPPAVADRPTRPPIVPDADGTVDATTTPDDDDASAVTTEAPEMPGTTDATTAADEDGTSTAAATTTNATAVPATSVPATAVPGITPATTAPGVTPAPMSAVSSEVPVEGGTAAPSSSSTVPIATSATSNPTLALVPGEVTSPTITPKPTPYPTEPVSLLPPTTASPTEPVSLLQPPTSMKPTTGSGDNTALVVSSKTAKLFKGSKSAKADDAAFAKSGKGGKGTKSSKGGKGSKAKMSMETLSRPSTKSSKRAKNGKTTTNNSTSVMTVKTLERTVDHLKFNGAVGSLRCSRQGSLSVMMVASVVMAALRL